MKKDHEQRLAQLAALKDKVKSNQSEKAQHEEKLSQLKRSMIDANDRDKHIIQASITSESASLKALESSIANDKEDIKEIESLIKDFGMQEKLFGLENEIHILGSQTSLKEDELEEAFLSKQQQEFDIQKQTVKAQIADP